jgi:hypothetical protein
MLNHPQGIKVTENVDRLLACITKIGKVFLPSFSTYVGVVVSHRWMTGLTLTFTTNPPVQLTNFLRLS